MPQLLSRRGGNLLGQQPAENLQDLVTCRSREQKPCGRPTQLGIQACSARGGQGCRCVACRFSGDSIPTLAAPLGQCGTAPSG